MFKMIRMRRSVALQNSMRHSRRRGRCSPILLFNARLTRLNRAKYILAIALGLVYLIVRLTGMRDDWRDTDWNGYTEGFSNTKDNGRVDQTPLEDPLPEEPYNKQDAFKSLLIQPNPTIVKPINLVPETSKPQVPSSTKLASAPVPTIPAAVLPDRKIGPAVGNPPNRETDEIHPISPDGRQEAPIFPPEPTTIHWEKQKENFPVPTGLLIHLPTGPPVSIPKIQHDFNDETPTAKINREKRLATVKSEFLRAWMGYKDHAWLHDELSPVSGNYRDPFCGWAATLVDSLDTLWIMGLVDEFEDAVKGVAKIDFTTSPRTDIPVFETTIRYLGGLLAAYDLSGGKYNTLLEKAVELAEILMGAFDTPNRMPILYYQWRPAFASQPHRANPRSSVAELGSLSMEFTRLAQLTKDPRYYDAVARVTIALSEFQDRGTKLGGVFPENVDASGCNRTIPSVGYPAPNTQSADLTLLRPGGTVSFGEPRAEGYKPASPDTVPEQVPNKVPLKGVSQLEMDIAEDVSGQSKARIAGWDENRDRENMKLGKRELPNPVSTAPASPSSTETLYPFGRFPPPDPTATVALGDWDCVPQGLDTTAPWGYDKFSMGGGQDSTYEYFPKQYLLLNGRDEVYKKLYLQTIKAVRKWMLFRPMVPNSPDILFSGAVTTGGLPETDHTLYAEVEHLTCFIGGMVGMGAKIFGIEGDLEIAKKLTEGCVWAYESTPTGIMPEGALVLPCESQVDCVWNQTTYGHHIDPMADQREGILQEYIANKAKLDAEAEAQQVAALHNGGLKQKRQIGEMTKHEAMAKAANGFASTPPTIVNDAAYQEKVIATEKELENSPLGRKTQTPLVDSPEIEPVDPYRPLSHEEYVAQRIKQASLPPGYVTVRGRKYILR